MGTRSKVWRLPEDVRKELEQRLIEGGFAGYEALADWLAEQGFEISTSSVHRFGQSFQERLAALRMATEQAKTITESLGDDAGALGDALTSVVQEKAFKMLMDLDMKDQAISFDKLGTMIAKLNSSSVQQKKLAMEVRERASRAAAEVDDITREAGLSDDVAAQIRAKILGIG